MRIFPTKEQYQKWSLPSKFSYLGVILAVISIVIALVFEGNPFKQVIGIDNTKKSLQLLEIAKRNRVDQDFAKMKSNCSSAGRASMTKTSFGVTGFFLTVAVMAAARAAEAAPCLIVTLTGTQSGPSVFNGQAGAGTLVRYGDDSSESTMESVHKSSSGLSELWGSQCTSTGLRIDSRNRNSSYS